MKIIVRNFNITFSIMVRTSKLKLNKVTEDLNTIKQLNLIGTYRTFYPAEYKFLSRAHETLSRIYHKLCHETSLNVFKRAEITESMFSNQNEIKLEIKNTRQFGEFTGNEG